MISHEFSHKLRMDEERKMTSEQRIEILSHWEEEGVDNDLLAVEISYRTNIEINDVLVILYYEVLYTDSLEDEMAEIDLGEIAEEIGNTYTTKDPELKGIEHISAECAFKVLDCEDDIFWEIGIYDDPDEDPE